MPFRFLPLLFIGALSFLARAEGENSFDRFLGSLSRGTHYLHGNTCDGVNEREAGASLIAASAAVCAKLGQPGSLTRQTDQLQQIASKVEEKAEDKFFALLSLQHSLELKCAAGGAGELAGEDPGGEKMKNIAGKIIMLRDAKLRLAGLASELSAKGIVGCGAGAESETPNPMYASQGQADPRAEGCRSLRVARLSYQALYESVPLAGTPSMQKYLNKAQVDRSMREDDTASIAAALKTAYAGAQKELNEEATRLKTLGERGGDKIDRPTRRALISDPARVQELVAAGGNSSALKGLACQADARYGAGADSFERAVTVGSIVLTPVLGAASLAVRGAPVVRAAAGARAAGTLSLSGTRLLQLGLLGVGGATSYEMLDRACWSKDSPRMVARGGAQCRDDFSIEQIKKEDCRLAGVMTSVGGVALLASSRTVQNFVKNALSTTNRAALNPATKISLDTEAVTSRFAEYDRARWKQTKLGDMFGPDAHEIRDALTRSGDRNSYIRYSRTLPDAKVNEPYITIDMVRGDPERSGLGQFLIKKVADENPGVPIYGTLARENGARFKKEFRSLAGQPLNDENLAAALARVPAMRSIPGRAILKPTYDDAGNLIEMGVVRYPDYSLNRVEFQNLDAIKSDPRFRAWMDSLNRRPPEYFNPNPEFN